jgi:single-strand DNA-binding protein
VQTNQQQLEETIMSSGSVNKAFIVGRVGKDPVVRTFEGGKVANFSVATSESWNDRQSGERQERTSWHNIAIFNEALAEIAGKHVKKGALVAVEGQLETRKWNDKDGIERYSTEVVLRPFRGELTMLDRAPDRPEQPQQRGASRPGPAPRG